MKWLTLDKIKEQCRIEEDFTMEDNLLKSYGTSAENTILKHLNRTYYDLTELYGEVNAETPAWQDIINASLMLVDVWYDHRSPVENLSMSIVPYTFDLLIKPYMKLAGFVGGDDYEKIPIGSDAKIKFTAELPDGLLMKDIDFSAKVINADTLHTINYTKSDCIMSDGGKNYVVLVDTEETGIGMLMMKLTVQIPDTDYPSGYRKEVTKINPKAIVTG